MKIFLVTKKTAVLFLVAVLCALCLFVLGTNDSVSVFNNEWGEERLLPIYRVDRGEEKVCALTFDAAWDDKDTDQLIEILNRYQVKATFFMVGSWVEKYPESVKKFADNGHEIMNHSDTHKYMTKLSNAELLKEVENCSKKIEGITNKKVNLFRAPYGDYNGNVVNKLKDIGYYTIQWDVDSLDWKDLSADEIITRVTENTKNGSIILFHNAAKNTPDALPSIIENLKDRGFEFEKVNKLIYKKNYYIDNTGKQINTK